MKKLFELLKEFFIDCRRKAILKNLSEREELQSHQKDPQIQSHKSKVIRDTFLYWRLFLPYSSSQRNRRP